MLAFLYTQIKCEKPSEVPSVFLVSPQSSFIQIWSQVLQHRITGYLVTGSSVLGENLGIHFFTQQYESLEYAPYTRGVQLP